MNLCVLRVWGATFGVDEFLATTGFHDYSVWYRGEARHKGHYDHSGFTLDVCEVDAEGLELMTQEARKFLEDNFDTLKRMMECPGVEAAVLDFAISKRELVAQFDRFPAELIRLAGSLGFGIELSQYLVSSDDEIS